MEHNPLNTAALAADPAAEPKRPYTAPTITNLFSSHSIAGKNHANTEFSDPLSHVPFGPS